MKSENKLQQALDTLVRLKEMTEPGSVQTEIINAIHIIHEVVADNMPYQAKGGLSVKDFVMTKKDDPQVLRPVMHYVYHDHGAKVAVATNSYILFANPEEYIEDEESCLRTYAGCKVDEKLRYPNWQRIINPDTFPVEIRPDLEKMMSDAYAQAKQEKVDKERIVLKVDGIHWMVWKHAKLILKAGTDGWTGETVKTDTENDCQRPMIKKWEGKTILICAMLPGDLSDEEMERGWFFKETKRKR